MRSRAVYGVIALSTLIATLVNFLGLATIDALFWTAVLDGFLAPPLLAVVMVISNSRRIMGRRTNGLGLNVLGWLTTAAMGVAAVGLALSWTR